MFYSLTLYQDISFELYLWPLGIHYVSTLIRMVSFDKMDKGEVNGRSRGKVVFKSSLLGNT